MHLVLCVLSRLLREEKPLRDPAHPDTWMQRWALGSWFGLDWHLHRYHGPPCESDPHDHHWDNGSLLLAGRLLELQEAGPRHLRPGQIVRRPATLLHMVRQVMPFQGRTWTLFWHGERCNSPHFYPPGRPPVPLADRR